MPISRDAVAQEVKEWIGTPWQHQAFHKGLGCDCIGLVRGVGENSQALVCDPSSPQAKRYSGYGRQPRPSIMRRALLEYFIPIQTTEATIGDILWFRVGKDPMHLGIISEPGIVVHADAILGRVIEHRIDQSWRQRVVGAYRFPKIET